MAPRQSALVAGISLVVMAAAAFFSQFLIFERLVIPGDADATLQQLMSSAALFRTGIFGWLVILVCDITAAWALYLFLKPVHEGLSLIAAWFRLVYAAMLGSGMICFVAVLLLTDSASAASSMPAESLAAQVLLYLNAFESIWSLALIVFGGHLVLAGYVASLTKRIPRLISILLLLAGVGYIAVHLGKTFLPQYAEIVTVAEYGFMAPMIAGELGFAVWLLFRGGKAAS